MLPGNPQDLSFSRDGKHLATVTRYARENRASSVSIWDWATAKRALVITVPDAAIHFASFSPDGGKLFTLIVDRKNLYGVRHWNLATGTQEREWTIPKRNFLASLGPGGKTVFTADHKGIISITDLEPGRDRLLAGQQRIWALEPSPDGRVLASGLDASDPGVRLWEVATAKEICSLKGHEGDVIAIAWSPDGRLLATGDRPGYTIGGTGLRLSPIHERLTTLHIAPTIRLWDTAGGKELARFGDFKADVASLTFSPDGSSVAAGLSDSTILMYDIAKFDPKLSRTTKLGKDDLEACWTDLQGTNVSKAHQAIGMLVGAPKQSIPFLGGRLQPALAADPGKIQQWITDFESTQFTVRQDAAKELTKVDVQAIMPLQKALKGGMSLEARRRLEQILKTISDGPGPEAIRTIRAIIVLERIGSPEARDLLEALALGAPGARETEEAKASVGRIKGRTSTVP